MTDLDRKNYVDENNQVQYPKDIEPKKHELAQEHLGLCLNCMDHILRCSMKMDNTLTHNQVENSMETLLNSINTLNQVSNELFTQKQEFTEISTNFMSDLKKGFTLGRAIALGLSMGLGALITVLIELI